MIAPAGNYVYQYLSVDKNKIVPFLPYTPSELFKFHSKIMVSLIFLNTNIFFFNFIIFYL